MQAHPLPTHRPTDYFDLLDEEFDNFENKTPHRQPMREQSTLMSLEKSWDDQFDNMDMMSFLQE